MKQTYLPPRCRVILIDNASLLSSSDSSASQPGRIEIKMNYNVMNTGYGDSNAREGGSGIWDEE